MSETIDKVKAEGPDAIALAEAKFFVKEGHLRPNSMLPRDAFELGVALATSRAHQEFVKTGQPAEIRDKQRAEKGVAYAMSPITKNTPGGDGIDSQAIREWARKRGMTVNDRGRIAQSVKDAYLEHLRMQSEKSAAKGKAEPKTRPMSKKAEPRPAVHPGRSQAAKVGAASRRAKMKKAATAKPASTPADVHTPDLLDGEKAF